MNIISTLKKVPVFRFLFPMIIGIIADMYWVDFKLYPIFFTLSFFLILLDFLIKRQSCKFRYRWIFGVGVFFFFSALGMALSAHKKEALLLFPKTQEQPPFCLAEIIENPKEKNATVECLVKIAPLTEKRDLINDFSNKIILYIVKDSSSLKLQYGDVILISNDLSEKVNTLNPGEFDYEAYLNLKGISTSAFIPDNKWKLISKSNNFSLDNLSKQTQLKLISILKSYGIKGDEFAILSALTLGNKEYLTDDLRESYSVTGASHILAVSGLHVGVVFVLLQFLLNRIFRKNSLLSVKIVILILSLWVYAFITGLSPSVVRASIMFSFVSVGIVLRRKSLIYNMISASAFLMLLYNPYYFFDISFQLSYVAVLSIVFFQNRIYSLLKFSNFFANKIWSLFTVSVAAQLGTFPLVLYYFHQFPNYFWLSGFIVVPLSGVIIYLTVMLFAFSVVPSLGECIAWVLEKILNIMNFSIRLIENFPCSVFRNISFELYDIFFVYLALCLFSCYLAFRGSRYLLLTLSCLLVYISLDTVIKYQKGKDAVFAVYNIPGITAVNKIEGGENYLFYNKGYQNIHQRINNFWIENRVPSPKNLTNNYFLVSDKKVLVLNDDVYKHKKQKEGTKLDVDFLIVSNDVSYSVEDMKNLFCFRMLIFDSSNSWYKLKKWKEQCRNMKITCHIVREEGAYCERF